VLRSEVLWPRFDQSWRNLRDCLREETLSWNALKVYTFEIIFTIYSKFQLIRVGASTS